MGNGASDASASGRAQDVPGRRASASRPRSGSSSHGSSMRVASEGGSSRAARDDFLAIWRSDQLFGGEGRAPVAVRQQRQLLARAAQQSRQQDLRGAFESASKAQRGLSAHYGLWHIEVAAALCDAARYCLNAQERENFVLRALAACERSCGRVWESQAALSRQGSLVSAGMRPLGSSGVHRAQSRNSQSQAAADSGSQSDGVFSPGLTERSFGTTVASETELTLDRIVGMVLHDLTKQCCDAAVYGQWCGSKRAATGSAPDAHAKLRRAVDAFGSIVRGLRSLPAADRPPQALRRAEHALQLVTEARALRMRALGAVRIQALTRGFLARRRCARLRDDVARTPEGTPPDSPQPSPAGAAPAAAEPVPSPYAAAGRSQPTGVAPAPAAPAAPPDPLASLSDDEFVRNIPLAAAPRAATPSPIPSP